MFIYGYIYGLRCKVNGKWYVGQTTSPNLKKYIRQEYEIGKGRCRTKIASAIKKYGWEAFELVILDTFARDREELNVLECFYMEYYKCLGKTGYNINPGGTNRKQSLKTVEKKIAATKKYWEEMTTEEYEAECESRRGENNGMFGKIPWNKGIKQSPEYCEKYILRGEESPLFGKDPWNKGLKLTPEQTGYTNGKRSHWYGTSGTRAIKVEIDGIIYDSKKAASKALHCHKRDLEKRFPTFRIIPKEPPK